MWCVNMKQYRRSFYFNLSGSWLSSCTLTSITVFIASEADFFRATKGWLFEGDSDRLLDVPPFDHAFSIFRLTWLLFRLCHVKELFEFFKDVFKTSCFCLLVFSTESLKSKGKRVEAEAFALSVCILLIVAWHTSRIVNLPFLYFSQSFVSLVDLSKHFGCVWWFIDIGMVLLCL